MYGKGLIFFNFCLKNILGGVFDFSNEICVDKFSYLLIFKKYLGYKKWEKIIVIQLSIFLDALTNREKYSITQNICKKLRNKLIMLIVVNPHFLMQSKILRY